MREIEGVNELHKANNAYNKYVATAIQLAKQATTPRDLIDLISDAKTIEDLNREAEIRAEMFVAQVVEQAKQLTQSNITENNIPEPEEEEER